MKKIKMITLLITGTFLVSLIYSCVKESMAKENDNRNPGVMEQNNNRVQALAATDSSCNLCSEHKTVTLTPAKFFGPYNGPGIEMNLNYGRATISDVEVQATKKLNVTAIDALGWETALPVFNMAADGSYESLSYKSGSSVLMLFYVRYNKSTNTFTYKPANNLTVKYSITQLN